MSNPAPTYAIEVRPSPSKTRARAWAPRDVVDIPALEDGGQLAEAVTGTMQAHLAGLDDDDLFNVRRPNRTYVNPKWLPVSDLQRT